MSGPCSALPRAAALGCLLALALTSGGCGKESLPDRWKAVKARWIKPPAPAVQVWSSEAIARNPEGYLLYASDQIDRQLNDRRLQLEQVAVRKVGIQQRTDAFAEPLREVENVKARLEIAWRKADDEQRWPLRLGGRVLDKETARSLIASAKQYLEERGPLLKAYQQVLARLDARDATLRQDVERLSRLKEKNALNLERVRLSKGIAEIEELKKTETELASFSDVLVDMTEDPLVAVPTPRPAGQQVTIESLIGRSE